jgi:hypothetical protein
MRFMKMLGMAMLAALASTALAGVGSAAAQEEHRVVFCKSNELLCKEGGAWPDETFFLGGTPEAEPPVFLSSLPQQCEKSSLVWSTLGSTKRDSLLIDIELLTFSGNCRECPEFVAENLAYLGHIDHVGENKYVLVVLNPLFQLHGCPIIGLCGYNEEELEMELANSEGYILALVEKAPLKRHAGSIFCPGSAEWDIHYLLLPSEGHEGEHLGDAWLALLALNE